MPEPTFGRVPFAQANAFLQRKLQLPSAHWDELRGAVHAHAFTAAGATKLQLVDDLHQAVIAARTGGETLSSFAKRFDEVVAKHGWSYRGNRAFRTRTIFQTNMATAAAAGHWEQMMRTKATRPYGMYLTADDHAVRDEHRRWHRIILPLDHPWWRTHYPPNGWGCRCTVVSLSESDLKRLGLEVSEAPDLERTDRVIGSTGEIVEGVPHGIDIGWDYNVGRAWMGPPVALGQAIAKLPPALRAVVASPQRLRRFGVQLQATWAPWIQDVIRTEGKTGGPLAVGYFNAPVLDALEQRGLGLRSALFSITGNRAWHLHTQTKDARRRRPRADGNPAGLTTAQLLQLPLLAAGTKRVYLDTTEQRLILVLASGDVLRLVIKPDEAYRGVFMSRVVTAGRVEEHNLEQPHMELLWRAE